MFVPLFSSPTGAIQYLTTTLSNFTEQFNPWRQPVPASFGSIATLKTNSILREIALLRNSGNSDNKLTCCLQGSKLLLDDVIDAKNQKSAETEFTVFFNGRLLKLEQIGTDDKPALAFTYGGETEIIDSPPMTIDAWACKLIQELKDPENAVLIADLAMDISTLPGTFYQFPELNFRGVDFTLFQFDFSSVALESPNFEGANLNGVNFDRTYINKPNFQRADLRGMHLSEGGQISEADCKGAQLARLTTSSAFTIQDLSDVDLPGVIWDGVKLNKSKLGGFNLTESNFYNVDLTAADLPHTNLSNVHWEHVCMQSANLNGANLNGARIIKAWIFGANFTNATFDDIEKFTIALPKFQIEANLDIYLNHLSNQDSGSFLTAIDTISDNYSALKIDLMHQIIDALGGIDIDLVKESLLDIWLKNPIYLEDPKINSFIQKRLLDPKITAANSSELKVSGTTELHLLLRRVSEHADQGAFMLKNNGFFIQLMMLCTEPETDPKIIQQAQAIYQTYLALPELSAARFHMDDILDSDTGLVDGLQKDLQNNPLSAGLCFAFLHQDNNGINHILLLSRTQIHDMLSGTRSSDCWNKIYYVQGENAVNNGDMDLTALVHLFVLFEQGYRYQQSHATFQNLLETLTLKYDNANQEPDLLSFDYTPDFVNALDKKQVNTKFISLPHQTTLQRIFDKLFVQAAPAPNGNGRQKEPGLLTEAHFAEIIAIYNLSQSTPTTQAQTLFCLASLFTRYSSSYYFGVEGESPVALREYAAALLKKAYEIDASIFGSDEEDQQNNYTEWMNKMLGNAGAFTCTAVLSALLAQHAAQDEGFNTILNGMRPPAWNN